MKTIEIWNGSLFKTQSTDYGIDQIVQFTQQNYDFYIESIIATIFPYIDDATKPNFNYNGGGIIAIPGKIFNISLGGTARYDFLQTLLPIDNKISLNLYLNTDNNTDQIHFSYSIELLGYKGS